MDLGDEARAEFKATPGSSPSILILPQTTRSAGNGMLGVQHRLPTTSSDCVSGSMPSGPVSSWVLTSCRRNSARWRRMRRSSQALWHSCRPWPITRTGFSAELGRSQAASGDRGQGGSCGNHPRVRRKPDLRSQPCGFAQDHEGLAGISPLFLVPNGKWTSAALLRVSRLLQS